MTDAGSVTIFILFLLLFSKKKRSAGNVKVLFCLKNYWAWIKKISLGSQGNTVRVPTGGSTRIGSWNQNDPKTMGPSIYDRNGQKHIYVDGIKKKSSVFMCAGTETFHSVRFRRRIYSKSRKISIRHTESLVVWSRDLPFVWPSAGAIFYRTIVRIHME